MSSIYLNILDLIKLHNFNKGKIKMFSASEPCLLNIKLVKQITVPPVHFSKLFLQKALQVQGSSWRWPVINPPINAKIKDNLKKIAK